MIIFNDPFKFQIQCNLETNAMTGCTNAGYENYNDCKHVIIEVQPAETNNKIKVS